MEFDEYITSKLTQKELDVAPLALEGLSNKKMSEKFNVSETTTKLRLASMYKKLGVINKANLAYVLSQHVIND